MPAIVAMVKEEQAVGDFQPKLMTRSDSEGGSNGARRKSSGRTNALYEHGKAGAQRRAAEAAVEAAVEAAAAAAVAAVAGRAPIGRWKLPRCRTRPPLRLLPM